MKIKNAEELKPETREYIEKQFGKIEELACQLRNALEELTENIKNEGITLVKEQEYQDDEYEYYDIQDFTCDIEDLEDAFFEEDE